MTKTPFKKTALMRRIEHQRGRTMEELLPLLFEQHRTNQAVARELGVSSMRLTQWLDLLGAVIKRERSVEHRTVVSFPNYPPVS